MTPIQRGAAALLCLAAACLAPLAQVQAANPAAVPAPGDAANATAHATVRLTVAGQPLPFPVPPGYVDAGSLSPELQRLGEAMTGPANRLVAFWVSPAEARAVGNGQAEGLKRYFMLQVHRQREAMALTEANFRTMRDAVIGDQAAFTQQLRQRVPGVSAHINQQLQQASGDPKLQIKMGEIQPLGVLLDEPQAFAYLLRTAVDTGDGRPAPLLIGTVMARHQDRFVALGVYALDDGPGAEAWVRRSAKAWTQALRAVR